MKIVQYTDNKYPFYDEYIAQVKNAIPHTIGYDMITETSIQPNCSDYRAVSNILRCKLAAESPDMVWMDTDVTIDKWFDFKWEKDKVYFAQTGTGRFVNWTFFVNGRCDFFADMYKWFLETKPDHIQWFYQYCLTRLDEIELIPHGYLTHEMMSMSLVSKINLIK